MLEDSRSVKLITSSVTGGACVDGDDYYASAEFRRERRFALRACGVGLLAAYGMVLPLKWYGLMPDHLGWLTLVWLPIAMFGLVAWIFLAPSVPPPPTVRHTYVTIIVCMVRSDARSHGD